MFKQRQELLDFALQLARAAADQIRPHYHNCVVDTKPDGTEVTEADRRAEEAVREMITRHFPDANILGEEFGATDGSKTRYRWVIDPLDGTTWFTLGVPIFGTLIAFLEDDEPLAGVIHFPVTGETIYAGKGLAAGSKEATPQLYRFMSLRRLD
jgi:fructose-1,6-bisphosphatase/inositol monophosphatase family enzyme